MAPFSRPKTRVFKPDFSRFSAREFLRTVPFQPAVAWVAAGAACGPLARALPGLTGAVCSGAQRQAVGALAYFALINVLPPLAAAAVYLPARRRFDKPALRFMGDATLGIVLTVSAVNAALSALSLHARWDGVSAGARTLRALCWP